MVFGGIPYYLNLIDRKYSLAQNIDQLCFDKTWQLHYEFDRLYASLFKHSERHIAIVRALSERSGGLTRAELERREAIGGGQPLTKALRELEQCGFLRKHRDFTKAKNGEVYQLVDPFSLFHLCFIEPNEFDSWISFQGMAAPYRMARPCVRARMPAACRSDEACARHLRHADERVRLAKHKKQSSCPDRSAHRPARRRDQRVRDEVR